MTVKAARAARVRALREAVARGTYHVDDDVLADALIRRVLFNHQLRATLQTRRPPPGASTQS